jgi:glycosyltransferase involved in cell wall biosynthesis
MRRIDAIMHVAGSTYVGESVRNPRAYFRDNSIGSIQLLDAALDAGIPHVIFSSTCARYGPPRTVPMTEAVQTPVSPYGEPKLVDLPNILETAQAREGGGQRATNGTRRASGHRARARALRHSKARCIVARREVNSACPRPLRPVQPAMRVALVHDWLTGMRGGEYVLDAIAELFPEAELFTLVHVPGAVNERLSSLRRHTAWLQRVPAADKYYRHFLPLMPLMIEAFDLTGFDLIVSSSHCVAKGIRKRPNAVHVSYVHAPMRYMWDRFEDYFGPGNASLPVRAAAWGLRGYLQGWDRAVSSLQRVDRLIANSHFTAEQMKRAYGRDAAVVHPFVDLSRFTETRRPGSHYLMVGAFAPNKRVDLAIEAFNRLRLPLLIVGKGQDEARLRRMAGHTVKFLGPLPNRDIAQLYSTACAFVFPGVEDFGITPLEAMASGLPVIAYAAGGALETVVDGETGVLFRPQTPEALAAAVRRIEDGDVVFEERRVRARAQVFTRERFQQRVLGEIRAAWTSAGKPNVALGAKSPSLS